MEVHSDLFPVGGNDAYVSGLDGSQALLCLCLQQFLHIIHQHLHLCSVEEWRAAGLTLIDACHPMENYWEVLRDTWDVFYIWKKMFLIAYIFFREIILSSLYIRDMQSFNN